MKDLDTAFTAAFDSYADELMRHAYYRLSDRDKALELTQECFLRAWDYARTGKDIKDIRAFLYRTLRNLIIDEYRRKKPSSLDAILEDENVSDAILADERDELAAAVDRLDGARALSLLPELPAAYAEVLLLRFVEGLAPSEIAARLEVSENVVSVRIHRALKALRLLAEPGAKPL
jgi:RNA polymerase sigma-70 factor (ECF subfamily)